MFEDENGKDKEHKAAGLPKYRNLHQKLYVSVFVRELFSPIYNINSLMQRIEIDLLVLEEILSLRKISHLKSLISSKARQHFLTQK